MDRSVKDKVCIVIPAFNEAQIISEVIDQIEQEGYKKIIVIDDGSTDKTYYVAKDAGVMVAKHLINRGKGAATQTGFDAAKILGAEIVVTMDADGQHSAKDISTLVKPIVDGECDVVLGSRFLDKNDIPRKKLLMNKIANVVTYIFFGMYVNDSQSGFRAYNKKALDNIYTDMDRYEYESQILRQIKYFKLRYRELPIHVKYTKYSQEKYKNLRDFQPQNFTNGINMLAKMIIRSLFS